MNCTNKPHVIKYQKRMYFYMLDMKKHSRTINKCPEATETKNLVFSLKSGYKEGIVPGFGNGGTGTVVEG